MRAPGLTGGPLLCLLLLIALPVTAQVDGSDAFPSPQSPLLLTQPRLDPTPDPAADLSLPELPDVSVNRLTIPSPSVITIADEDDDDGPTFWLLAIGLLGLGIAFACWAITLLSTRRDVDL